MSYGSDGPGPTASVVVATTGSEEPSVTSRVAVRAPAVSNCSRTVLAYQQGTMSCSTLPSESTSTRHLSTSLLGSLTCQP